MESAIRWYQNSTSNDQRFLLVDVSGRSLKLCKLNSIDKGVVQYDTLFSNSKVPAFRAFDLSPNDSSMVAVGQSSGEVTVLRLDEKGSHNITFSLPIRNQRYCNAVAFSSNNLLAAGLDKVRNDFCLNVWDVTQQAAIQSGTSGENTENRGSEPLRRLASSEPITSLKFFADQPQTLVAGVKGQFIRLYDLRGMSNKEASLYSSTEYSHRTTWKPFSTVRYSICSQLGN